MKSALVTVNLRSTKVDVASVLEEVEMSPNFIGSVMNYAVFLAADRTMKLCAANEIDANMKFAGCFIEFDTADKQRTFNPQCSFE